MKKYGELEDERNKAYEKLYKGEVCEEIYDMFSDEEGNIYNNFDVKELEVARKRVEIERCMLLNEMFDEQEKEIVKYNIRK